MPRASRLHLPGSFFHIICRALNREFLFDGDEERKRYVGLLEGASRRAGVKVVAWCVMSNHVHLVLQTGEEPLYRMMKRVNVGYANWKNRRDGRLGPVFAHRYKAILVDEDAHLLELIRYVHLNPVRAGVVAGPDDSDWSSHRILAGLSRAPNWFDPNLVWHQFAENRSEAIAAYRSFVAEGIGEERSPVLSGDAWLDAALETVRTSRTELRVSDPILGSEDFVSDVLARLKDGSASLRLRTREARRRWRPPLDSIIDLICEELDVSRVAFDEHPKRRASAHARQVLARIWVQEYKSTQTELARLLKVAPVLVSRWYAKSSEKRDEQYGVYRQVVDALPGIESLETAGGEVVPQRGKASRVTVNVEFVEE
jgi:putative transposase